MPFWEVWEEYLAKVSAAMNACATAWIGVIMFVAVADVVVREASTKVGALLDLDVSSLQLTGTHEIVRWSIVAIAFLQFPHCLREGRHVRSDYFLSFFPHAGQAALNLAAHLLGFLLFLLIFIGSWPNMITGWSMGEFEGEGAIRLPIYPMRTILTLGCLVFSLEFLVRLLKDVRALLLGHYPGARPAARPGERRAQTPSPSIEA